MRTIILKLKNLATNCYPKLTLFASLSIFTYHNAMAINIFYSNQKSWEASVLPIIEGTPAVDNGGDLYGGRLALSYFFYNYKQKLELGVDGSIAHIKTSRTKDEPVFSKSITIYSPALIARWNFDKINSLNISPFVAAGVGPSYLSNNDFEGRDLGLHFAFQDIGGLGFKTKVSPKDELVFGVYIIHYSNASLSEENRGITIPFSARLAYRF